MQRDLLRITNTRLGTLARPLAKALAVTVVLAVALPMAASEPAEAQVTVTSHFVWTADSANTAGDSAYIVNGATDGEPNDLLFVTPNFTPNGLCGCVSYEPDPIGVWYNSSYSEWAVLLEDGSAMPVGLSFNVLVVPKVSNSVFVQTATSSNTSDNYTFINSSLTNGKKSAMIQVTQDWNPGDVGGTYDPHPTGVWYDTSNKEWAIFNEDEVAMPLGAAFNVMVGASPSNGGKTAVLKTTKSDESGDATYISNAETTGNPNNVTFVTQDWNPGGKGGTYNAEQPVVWYAAGPKEAVFDDNDSPTPLGSAFNLLIFSS